MSPRKRSVSAWVRILHRWISLAFVVAAALVIIPVIPQGAVWNTISTIAILLLILLLLTGIWTAVHHYVVRIRASARRTARSASAA